MGQWNGEQFGEEGMQLLIPGPKVYTGGDKKKGGVGESFPHLVRGKEMPL